MKSPPKLPRLAVVSCVALWGVASADDEATITRWGGALSSNMTSGAKDLPADLDGLTPLWELQLGTHQYSIPTIDRGRIYIGANDGGIDRKGVKRTGGGLLLCVEQETGKLLWQLYSPRYLEGVIEPYHYNQWKCGFCSGPVVDGDRVYVVGGRGEVLCLDRDGQADGNDGPFLDELDYMQVERVPGSELGPTDGDIVWRFDFLKDIDVVPHDVCGSTILLHGELLYVCTSNGVDGKHRDMPRPEAPSLIVLDKRSGRLVASEGEKIGTRTLHGHWSSPAHGVVDGSTLILFGGGDGILYAFEPLKVAAADGTVQTLRKVWSHDCNPPDYRVQDGNLIPYSRWNHNSPEGPSEIIGTPVFFDGRVYVTIGQSPVHGVGKGQLSCLDARTGDEVWASKLVDRSLATPAVAGGLVYVVDYTGRLHCFDAVTGERHWVHDLETRCWGSSTFVADGRIYVSGEDNSFWVFVAGKEKQLLSKTRFKSVPITPAAVDGVLYIATQKRFLAYSGRKTVSRAEGQVERLDE